MATTQNKSQLDFDNLANNKFVGTNDTRNLISISGSNVFQYSVGVATPVPSQITLTAVLTGVLSSGSPQVQWQYLDALNVWTDITGATGINFIITYNAAIWTAGVNTLRLRVVSRGYAAEITILKDYAVDANTFYQIYTSSPVITKAAADAATTGTYSSVDIRGIKYIGSTQTYYGYVTVTKNGETEAAVATNTADSAFVLSPTSTSQASSYTVKLYDSSNKTTLLDSRVISVVFGGATATASYVVVNGEQVFKYLTAQTTPVNTSIVLSAQLYGTLTTYDWEYYNGTAWVNLSGTNNTQTYTLAHDNAAWGTATTLRIRCLSSTYSDEITIAKLYDGTAGISAILSNESHTLPASTTGVVSSYANSATQIRVFEGATPLQYTTSATPGNGQWRVGATSTNITAGTVSVLGGTNNTVAVTTAALAMSNTSDTAQITWTITGKSAAGASFTLEKRQDFAKAKTGATGNDAAITYLSLNNLAIKRDVSGTYTPNSITASSFRVVGNGTPTATAGVFKIYINDSTNPNAETGSVTSTNISWTETNLTKIKVELYNSTGTTLLDTQTIPVISDGATGSSGIVVDLSNDSHVLTADVDGNIASGNYATSGTIIRVFEGASELTYTTATLSSGTWTISNTTSATNITRGAISAVSGQKYAQSAPASAMTTDTASINWVITGQSSRGVAFTVTQTQTFSKSKSGVKGDPGDPGTASSIKYITLTADEIKTSTQTGYNPATVTATAKEVVGSSLATNYAGRFKVYEDGVELTNLASSSDTATVTWTPVSQNAKQLKFELYAAGGFTTLLDTEIVPVLSSAVVADLTNDSHILPANSAGTVANFAGAETTAQIFLESQNDSNNWNFYVNEVSNCSYCDAEDTVGRTDTGFIAGNLGGQNLLRHSQEFNNTVWFKQPGTTVIGNTFIAPDGTLTADTLTRTTGAEDYQNFSAIAGITYTFSIWMRSDSTITARIKLGRANNNPITSVNCPLSTTWKRFSVTFTSDITATGFANIDTITAGSIHIWGAQLNTGSTALGYIPTTATAKNSQRGYLKIVGLTQDTGYVDISAYNIPTNQTITQRFSLAKSKTGTDSKVYYLTSNTSIINQTGPNIYNPSSLQFNAFSVTGNQTPQAFSGTFKVYLNSSSTAAVTQTGTTLSYTPVVEPTVKLTQVKVELYDNTTLLDTETIAVVNDVLYSELTNDSHVLSANNLGTVSSFIGAETQLNIYRGTQLDTNNWTFYVSALSNCSYRDSDDTGDRTGTGIVNGGIGGNNFITGSSFETDSNSDGWADNWTNYTQTGNQSLANDYVIGTKSQRFEIVGTASVPRIFLTANRSLISNSTQYTLSGYMKAPAGTQLWAGYKTFTAANGGSELNQGSGTTVAIATGSWQRVTFTFVSPDSGAHYISPMFGVAAGTAVGTVILLDAVQLELGNAATEYNFTSATAVSSGTPRGFLKVVSLTEDNGYIDITATKIGETTTFTQRFSLSKSKTGTPGQGAKALFLTSTSQVFQVSKTGIASPASVTFNANPTGGLTGTATFAVTGTATITGSGNTRQLTYANMSTDTVTIDASITDGGVEYKDSITVVKLREGTDAVTGLLTNESATVSAATDGTVGSFAGVSTQMKVYIGTTDDTANWTFSKTDGTGVTSTISTNTVSITAMSADTGFVDITASRTGYTSVTKRFILSKSKTGSKGDPGDASVIKYITLNADVIKTNTETTYNPATVIATAKQVSGTGVPTDFNGRFKVYEDGVELTNLASSSDTATVTWTPVSQNTKQLKFELYAAGGFTTLLDTEIVPVLSSGVVGTLTNDSHVLAANTDGTVASYDTATTSAIIYSDGIEDSQNWSFYVSGLSNSSYRDSTDTANRTDTGFVAGSFGGQNLLTYSQDFTNTNWTKESGFGTITNNFGTAPDGTQTSTRLVYTGGYLYRRLTTAPAITQMTPGTTITFSCWVKGTAQPGKGIGIWSYTSSGLVASSSQNINPSTWTRCIVTYTVPQTGGDFALNIAGAATNLFKGTIEVWGAQLNIGSKALGYTPTTAAAKNSQRGYLRVTELTQDGGYVDISAYNVPTNQTITQRFSLSKSKTGATGTSAIQVALSNDNHIFSASSFGTIGTYTGSGTEIRVYEGANQLSYLGLGTSFTSSDLGRWRISAVTASGITQSTGNLSSQTSDGVNYAVISAASEMSDVTDIATITYTIVGRTLAGQEFTRTAQQQFSKSKTGQRASVANEIANQTAWSDADANAYFTANYGGVKVVGDRITMYDTATAFVATKFWNGSAWVAATATIDGNLLITGTITGNKLATNTITSNKLLVTGRGVALNDDPNMMDGSAWISTASGVSPTIEFVSITDGISGTTAARGSGGVHLLSRTFAVDTTKKYRIKCKVRRNSAATGTFYLRLYRYNSAGAEVGFTAGIEAITLENTNWRTFTSEAITVESNAVLARVAVVLNWNTTAGYMEVQDLRCEQDSADLIVDGSISATKLTLGGSNASVFSDIGFQDVSSWGGSAWGGTPALIKGISDAAIGKNVAYIPAGSTHYTIGWRASTRPVGWIPIDKTKQYRLRVRYRAPAGNGGKRYIGLTQCDQNGGLLGNNNGHAWYTEAVESTTNTNWVLHESIVGSGTDYVFYEATRFVSPAFLFNWNDSAAATNTGEIQVSGFEFEELLTGSLIVNGSITANKINTKGLQIRDENDKIIFSSGIKLAPEYADPILSTTGQNLIPNSEQTQTPCFGGLWNPYGATLTNFNQYAYTSWQIDSYTLPGITTKNIYSRQEGILSGGDEVVAFDTYPTGGWGRDNGISVVAGKKYIYSCYIASHRCKFTIGFSFWNAAGTELGHYTAPIQTKTDNLANRLELYRRPYIAATAPTGATTISMFIRKYNTDSGTDSYIWYAAPMLEQVNSSQTEPSPYQPGPATNTRQLGYSGALDATKGATLGTDVYGKITEGNVANLIATGAITGTYIADLTVSTAKIANLAVDNAKIANAAVNNAKIDNLAVSTLKIGTNAVTVPIAVNGGGYASSGFTIRHVFDPELPEGIDECKGVVLWQATTDATRGCNWYAYLVSGNRDPAVGEGYWWATGGRYVYTIVGYTPYECGWDIYTGGYYCYGNQPIWGWADVGQGNGTHNYYSANQVDPYIGWNRAGNAYQDAPVILGVGTIKRGTNTVAVYWSHGGGSILNQRLSILGAKR